MRPVLLDINESNLAPRLSGRGLGDPAAGAAAGRAAADQPDHRPGRRGAHLRAAAAARRSALDVLVAMAVATTISLELTVLLSKSILRPIADLQRATEAVRRGPLRRLGAGDHRRRARRARRLLQPDGRGPRRARADPRGVRHLPRQVGRRVHPQRGVRRGGGRGRGLDPVLRRARLHRLRRHAERAGGRRARSTSCSRSSSRSSPATAATSTSSSATACWRSSARPEPFPDHADRAVRAACEIGDQGQRRATAGGCGSASASTPARWSPARSAAPGGSTSASSATPSTSPRGSRRRPARSTTTS